MFPDHQKLGGILGSTGIWWDAECDPRYGLITMGMIFSSLGDMEATAAEA